MQRLQKELLKVLIVKTLMDNFERSIKIPVNKYKTNFRNSLRQYIFLLPSFQDFCLISKLLSSCYNKQKLDQWRNKLKMNTNIVLLTYQPNTRIAKCLIIEQIHKRLQKQLKDPNLSNQYLQRKINQQYFPECFQNFFPGNIPSSITVSTLQDCKYITIMIKKREDRSIIHGIYLNINERWIWSNPGEQFQLKKNIKVNSQIFCPIENIKKFVPTFFNDKNLKDPRELYKCMISLIDNHLSRQEKNYYKRLRVCKEKRQKEGIRSFSYPILFDDKFQNICQSSIKFIEEIKKKKISIDFIQNYEIESILYILRQKNQNEINSYIKFQNQKDCEDCNCNCEEKCQNCGRLCAVLKQ